MKFQDDGVTGLTSLRQVDPRRATAINAIIALICGNASFRNGGDTLAVDAHAGGDVTALAGSCAGAWFATDGGHWFAISRINDAATVIAPSRLDDAVAVLSAVEPLLVHLETRLGLSFEPVDIAATPASGTMCIAVNASREDVSNSEAASGIPERIDMMIAFDPAALDVTVLVAAASERVAAPADCPVVYRLGLYAPVLTMDQATSLDRGDVIVLGHQVRARMAWAGGDIGGTAGLHGGIFTADGFEGNTMSAVSPSAPSTHQDRGSNGSASGFGVTLTIALPPRAVSAATLGDLRPGMTLPIGALTAGIGVELQVAGRAIAYGEIVQLGDQFAVMIEQRADLSDSMGTVSPAQPAPPVPPIDEQD